MCGFRPTGRLHIGHYFSVIKPGQDGAEVLIANYHAPEEHNINETVDILKRFGVKSIKIQKDIFNAQMFFELLNLSKIGDLGRMTQYKSCAEEDRTGQLLTYPVLMAHDVAGYELVLVGEDQRQHLEYARKLLRKYNRVTGSDYFIPAFKVMSRRIQDLRFTDKKMSKSSPEGCLFLDDSPESVAKKLRAATMDEAGRENLVFLYNEFVGPNPPESNQKLKEELAVGIVDRMNKFI